MEGLPGAEKEYVTTSMNFAFITSPEEGRKQLTRNVKCREYLNDSVRNAMSRIEGTGYNKEDDRHWDPTMTRLLLTGGDGSENWKLKLFSGKACLNLLEEIAGWEKSTIATVVHNVYENAWLFTGPAEWVSSPPLLSLATWVLRIATKAGPLDSSNYGTFEKNILDIAKNPGLNDSDCSNFAMTFWNRMYVMVKFQKEIFDNISAEEAWCTDMDLTGRNFGFHSGFYSFCRDENEDFSFGLSRLRPAREKFRELCKEMLPRKSSAVLEN